MWKRATLLYMRSNYVKPHETVVYLQSYYTFEIIISLFSEISALLVSCPDPRLPGGFSTRL